MELNELKFDDAKMDGVWVEYGDARFLIRSTQSKAYQRAVQREQKKYSPHEVRKNPEVQTKIAIEAAAVAIVVDFEGVTENGAPLENTLENRRKLMAAPALRDWIADQATDLSNFQQGGEEADSADLKSED